MKLLVILKTNYIHTPAERQAAHKTFLAAIKPLTYIKVVEEIEGKPQVIIELPDDQVQKVYAELAKIEVVFMIDSFVPSKKAIKIEVDKKSVSSNPPSGKRKLTIEDLKRLKK